MESPVHLAVPRPTSYRNYRPTPLLWLLVAAILGFLYWNWSPAKIFMGDAGSTFLGAIIAIALLNQPHNPVHSWTSLFITLPLLADAIYTLIRRLINRENIFRAHRSHLYQRLQQSGLPHSTVATIYILVTTAFALLILNYDYLGAIVGVFVAITAIVVGELYLLQKNRELNTLYGAGKCLREMALAKKETLQWKSLREIKVRVDFLQEDRD